MTDIELGILFNELKNRLTKKLLYDLFVALDEKDDTLHELLGNIAQENFPEKF